MLLCITNLFTEETGEETDEVFLPEEEYPDDDAADVVLTLRFVLNLLEQ
jgi:hypothetical protein